MLKTLFCAFFLLFSVGLFSQNKKEINPNGHNVFFYPDGTKASEGNFKEGKPEGYWKTYFENGQLKSEGNRKNHQLDSLWRFFADNGALIEEITYEKGKRNGVTRVYNEEGLLASKIIYKNDLKTGQGLFYYPEDRKVHFERPFIEGKEHGIGYELGKDGRVISIIEYEMGFAKNIEVVNRRDTKGRKNGFWVEFYEGEQDSIRLKRLQGRYRNDLKNGYFREYDKKGELLSATKYINGEIVQNAEELQSVDIKRDFHSNAKVHWEKTYWNGKEHGVWKEFNDTGAIVHSKVYEKGILLGEGVIDIEGKKQGPWKEYYSSGELRGQGSYLEGERYGKWKFFHPSGKVAQYGKYGKGGLPTGPWEWFYENGSTWRTESFIRGKEDGEILEYDSLGNEILKGQYYEGLAEGKWVIISGDYREEGEYLEGFKQGEWKAYYRSNDKLAFKGEFIEDDAHGKHVYYFDNGRKMLEGKFELGLKQGDWKRYNDMGELILTIRYKDGQDARIDGRKVKPSHEEVENEWDDSDTEE